MKNYLFVFFIGLIIGILACNIVYLSTPVYANEGAPAENSGIIAVTGLCATGQAGLWVIDAKDTKTSPSVCLYVPENGGRGFKFAGARRIKHDLMVVQYEDRSAKNMSPSKVKKNVEEAEKKGEDSGKKGSKKNED